MRNHILFACFALSCLAIGAGGATARNSVENNRALPVANDKPVVLPAFVVRAMRIDKTPWSYAAVPDFEILSRASDDDTQWILDALRRGKWLEEQLLPPEWIMSAPVPYIVIIDDADLEVRSGEVQLQPLKFNPPADALTWGRFSSGIRVTTERMGAGDHDTYAISRNVRGATTGRPFIATLSLERLTRSTPPLPSWLNAGLLGPRCGVFRESFANADDNNEIGVIGTAQNSGIMRSAVGPGTLWISIEETRRLLAVLKADKKRHLVTKIPMLPLHRLFAESRAPEEDPLLWESQAALFVRWGLTGPGHEDPASSQAFREFVRRARREPATESMFKECFGFGYAQMEEKLEEFLRAVIAKPNVVRLDFPREFPEPVLKPATTDQIGRLLADWLRLQAESLRQSDPELSGKLFYAAGRTLRRTYQYDNGLPPDVDPASPGTSADKAPRSPSAEPAIALKPFVVTAARIHDPGLLAVYGLYARGSGDDDTAREFLEKAIKTGATKPAARLVVAQINYTEAMAHPLGAGGKISRQQAIAILAPIATLPPPSWIAEAYTLTVQTWIHCEARASAEDIARIVEGVERFPRNTQLAYASALVCAGSDDFVHAAALIDRGLIFVTDDAEHDKFERLRQALTH